MAQVSVAYWNYDRLFWKTWKQSSQVDHTQANVSSWNGLWVEWYKVAFHVTVVGEGQNVIIPPALPTSARLDNLDK